MRRLSTLLRTGLALAAGLLLAATLAGPVAAEPPESPPQSSQSQIQPFYHENTQYNDFRFIAEGEIEWLANGTARVSGTADRIDECVDVCDPIDPEQEIVFTAYDADGIELAQYEQPFATPVAPDATFDVTFLPNPSTEAEVDRIDLCVQDPGRDGTQCFWGSEIFHRGDVADEAQRYFYEFLLPDACYKATVDATLEWPHAAKARVEGFTSTELTQTEIACDPVPHDPIEYRVVFTVYSVLDPPLRWQVPYAPGAAEEFGLDLIAYSDPGGTNNTIDFIEAEVCGFDPEGALIECREDSLQRFDPVVTPQEDYCEYAYTVPSDWYTGFQGQIDITPLVEPALNWRVVITFPGGQQIQTVWNAEVTQSGSTTELTNTSWNGTIPVGGTAQLGFIASGPSDPPPIIEVYVNGRPCAAA